MKLIFFGTPDFSLRALEALDEKHEVLLVVTQPDKRKGRGKKMQMTPVKEYALKKGIPVFQPENVNSPDAMSLLREKNADLAVVVAYGQLLKEQLLDLPSLGCYNIHASLLPLYRGAAPIHRAIIGGEEKTGITIMKMDKGMDTGNMILQREIPIETNENVGNLHDKLAELGASAVLEALDMIESGKASETPQDDSFATYAPKLTKETGEIDWRNDSEAIRNLVRGLNPWPAAYTFYKGKKMKIFEAECIHCKDDDSEPGTYLGMFENCFLIKTGNDCLLVKRIQFPSKKAMNADDYARGHSLEIGHILGN